MIKYVNDRIHLICDACGYTQIIRKSRFDKYLRYELENCKLLYYERNTCKDEFPRTVSDGYFSHWIFPLNWTTVLDSITARSLQPKDYNNGGGHWSGMANPSIEYIQSVKRAKPQKRTMVRH